MIPKCCSLPGHILMISQFVGGERFVSSLPKDVQDLLAETGREAGLFMNDLIVKAEAEAVAKLEVEGTTFNQVDKAAFKRAAQGVYEQFPLWTPGLYDRVQRLLEEYRKQHGGEARLPSRGCGTITLSPGNLRNWSRATIGWHD